MVTISSDHAVTRFTRRDQTRANGFLPDIQVHETADLASLVQLRATFLDAADEHHLVIQIEQLFLLH